MLQTTQDIDKLLTKIGKKIFVDYFEYFNNSEMTTQDIYSIMPDEDEVEGFTHKSKVSRVSKSRKIINEGHAIEALKIIINSSRVEKETKKKAQTILDQLLQSNKHHKADSNIPDEITAEYIKSAAKDYHENKIQHSFKDSTTYDVIIDGNRYPPKAIIGLAARYIIGKPLHYSNFGGGIGTKCFRILQREGFQIVPKSDAPIYPDEVSKKDIHYEGAVKQTVVNKYERDTKARDKCIEHYGLKCQVCSFDFEEAYGELGAGFIHVHHLTPISEIGEEYQIKPIEDLRPVCPNCHAMLHKKSPPLSIEQLQKVMK